MDIIAKLIESVLLGLGTYKLFEILVKSINTVIEKYSKNK